MIAFEGISLDSEQVYFGSLVTDYSGSGSGECTLNVAAVCCKSVINIIATMSSVERE